MVMRWIFKRGRAYLIDAVKHFELGMPGGVSDLECGCNHILFTIHCENYSKHRKVAVGETDFVQLLLLDIIPALHCHYLLSRAKHFNLEEDFRTKKEKDNLLWVLFYMVQFARKHAAPWYSDVRWRKEKIVKSPEDLLNSKRYGMYFSTFDLFANNSSSFRERTGTFLSKITMPHISSCVPNARLVNGDEGVFLVAISFIGRGDRITLDLYNGLSMDVKDRRAFLKEKLGADCK